MLYLNVIHVIKTFPAPIVIVLFPTTHQTASSAELTVHVEFSNKALQVVPALNTKVQASRRLITSFVGVNFFLANITDLVFKPTSALFKLSTVKPLYIAYSVGLFAVKAFTK